MNSLNEESDFSFLGEKPQTEEIKNYSIFDDPSYIRIELCASAQNDFSLIPKSSKSSMEMKRKKNREAAKRSRQKKKQGIINLINENKQLNYQIETMKSEMERKLCYDCKCQMNLIDKEMLIMNDTYTEEEITLSRSPSVSFTKGTSLVFFTILAVVTIIGLVANLQFD